MAVPMSIVPFWKSYDRRTVLRTAQLAEELGYDAIWVPEAWAYEQFQLLTEIAVATKRLRLATGIANVFSRSPGLLAMSIATLDEISEGRAILGLGTSGKLVVDRLAEIRPGMPIVWAPELERAAAITAELARPGDLVLTIGAGDIDRAGPAILDRLRP